MTSAADIPDIPCIYRRSSFRRLLARAARDIGYQTMYQNWSQGLIVHYRKEVDMHLKVRPTDYEWKIINILVTEMTDDKIKELLVRWRMGL